MIERGSVRSRRTSWTLLPPSARSPGQPDDRHPPRLAHAPERRADPHRHPEAVAGVARDAGGRRASDRGGTPGPGRRRTRTRRSPSRRRPRRTTRSPLGAGRPPTPVTRAVLDDQPDGRGYRSRARRRGRGSPRAGAATSARPRPSTWRRPPCGPTSAGRAPRCRRRPASRDVQSGRGVPTIRSAHPASRSVARTGPARATGPRAASRPGARGGSRGSRATSRERTGVVRLAASRRARRAGVDERLRQLRHGSARGTASPGRRAPSSRLSATPALAGVAVAGHPHDAARERRGAADRSRLLEQRRPTRPGAPAASAAISPAAPVPSTTTSYAPRSWRSGSVRCRRRVRVCGSSRVPGREGGRDPLVPVVGALVRIGLRARRGPRRSRASGR